MGEQCDTYRSAVLHHRVLHLVTLGNTAREEAALANVIVEMLQASIPAQIKGGGGGGGGSRGRESIQWEKFTAVFCHRQPAVKILPGLRDSS